MNARLRTLLERARFLASGQDDPQSVTIGELCDEIETLARIETDRPRRETGSVRSMRAGSASTNTTPSSQDTDQ